MCIVLITTAHPSYALIVLDNRDEFILRPTSKPHWWTPSPSPSPSPDPDPKPTTKTTTTTTLTTAPKPNPKPKPKILSSRDLQRQEQGTWMGITTTGNFAVLTNYRETVTNDPAHPICGTKSRGGMVTAWLTASEEESTEEFVHRMLGAEEGGVKGIGGFSLLCGKLRKKETCAAGGDGGKEQNVEPLAIISNRCGSSDDVPWIAGSRGEVYGLSNTIYSDPEVWPKVQMGKEKLLEVIDEATSKDFQEEKLMERFWEILDVDTLPKQEEGTEFEDFICELRKSIFIPSIGGSEIQASTPKADEIASASPVNLKNSASHEENKASVSHSEEEKVAETPYQDPGNGMSGIYGTQRQTIMLVDWEGRVTYVERALWDGEGNPIPRGDEDERFEFQIEGWRNGSRETRK